MRNPEFKIDLSLYQEAMNLSLHDEVWFHNALRNRENLREITKSLTKEDCDIAVNRFTANKDIGEFLKFKKNEVVDEDTLNILLNTSSKESKSKIIQLISKKTENHAAIVSALLNEYCQQTRDIFDAKILAFLENIEEAFKSKSVPKNISTLGSLDTLVKAPVPSIDAEVLDSMYILYLQELKM